MLCRYNELNLAYNYYKIMSYYKFNALGLLEEYTVVHHNIVD